jgi:hypothetical protein
MTGSLSQITQNLATVMMMTMMMTPASRVGRNHRTSQNDKRNSGEK